MSSVSENMGQGIGGATSIHIPCVPDAGPQLCFEINLSGVNTLEMRMCDVIVNVTDQTCPLLSRNSVRWERMSEGMSVELRSESPVKLPGMVKKPGSPRIARSGRTRSTFIPRAKFPRDWASVPLELVKSRVPGISGRIDSWCTVGDQNTFSFEPCVESGVCSYVPQNTVVDVV